MYRNDLDASFARVEALQAELKRAQSQGSTDQQRIAMLTSQLQAMQLQMQRLGQYQAQQMPSYLYPPRSSTILTLGILSLAICSIMGPIAWAMGNEELRRIDMGQTDAGQRGSVVAGRVCGIIASSLLMLGGLMFFLALLASS